MIGHHVRCFTPINQTCIDENLMMFLLMVMMCLVCVYMFVSSVWFSVCIGMPY